MSSQNVSYIQHRIEWKIDGISAYQPPTGKLTFEEFLYVSLSE